MAFRKNLRSNLFKSDLDVDPENLSSDGKIIVTLLTKQIELLREEFKEQLQVKDKIIDDMKIELNTVRVHLLKMEEKLEEEKTSERKNTIVFSGNDIPAVANGENCSKVVCDLIKSQLNLNISPSDISSSERLGKKSTDVNKIDRRSISVKLSRHDQKKDILSACRTIKPNFYVNESLTPARSTILYVLRKMKRKHPAVVDGCSSIDGRVYAWVKSSDKSNTKNTKVPVNSHLQLVDFCRDVVADNLQSFLDVWPH